MNVLILAAGFGTRLYPLTKNIPKALVDINKKPAIEYALNKISELEGIEKIYIISNNKFYINFLEWKETIKAENKELADKIKIMNNGVNKEENIKGVVRELKDFLDIFEVEDCLLVLACDNLFNFDLNELIKLKKEKNSSSIALKKIENTELIRKYSSVLIDSNDKIIHFEEKPENPKSNLVSVFCYLLRNEDLRIIRDSKEVTQKNVIEFLYDKTNIYGKIFSDFWIDIGSLEELTNAEEYFKKNTVKFINNTKNNNLN